MCRRISQLIVASAALSIGACTSDPVTSLVTPPASLEASAALTPTGYASSIDLRLLAELEKEKTRIALARLTGEAERTALLTIWKTLELANDVSGLADEFLVCEPLPYSAETKIVGPPGATFTFGPHHLVIPRGALTRWYVITAESPVSLHAQARFYPHGLTFPSSAPAPLTISYGHCNSAPNASTQVLYVDGSLNVLEWLASSSEPGSEQVSAVLGHFSSYLVAY